MNEKEKLLKASLYNMKELLGLEQDKNKYRIRNIINSLEFELYNFTNKWETIEEDEEESCLNFDYQGEKIMYEQELEYYDYDCLEQETEVIGCIQNEEGVFYI